MKKNIAEIIATIFYAGYFPVASGTLGSLIGMAIYYPIKDNIPLYLFVTIIMFVLGVMSSDVYEKHAKKKDPHEVIIDEVAGVFLVYLFIPFSVKIFVIGFFVYRFFDIIKPPPIRRLEALPGGLGIMTDDTMAGIYTNIILRILLLLKI